MKAFQPWARISSSLSSRITKPELGACLVTRDDNELEIRAQGWNAFISRQ